MKRVETILVPIGFCERSRAALRFAAELARAMGPRLVLLHVVQLNIASGPVGQFTEQLGRDAHRQLKEWAEEFCSGCTVETAVRSGDPWKEIVIEARARHADLIVLGTHNYPAFFRLLLNSRADRVLHHAPCPVLVVPPP